jgi:hypothetical protein
MMGMTISLKRDEIIEMLRNHRRNHLNEYDVASNTYKVEKIKLLKSALDSALRDEDVKIDVNMGLQKPIDNSKKYDEMINTFEMVQTELIELEFEDAKHIANDTFPWLDASKFVNAFYSSRR